MCKKNSTMFLMLFLSLVFSASVFAAKVPAPATGAEGVQVVTLSEAEKLLQDGATFVACHSHTTDFMKGHPAGTIHIPCMVPKDHKRTDLALSEVDFDVTLLPKDKNTPIVLYCASGT